MPVNTDSIYTATDTDMVTSSVIFQKMKKKHHNTSSGDLSPSHASSSPLHGQNSSHSNMGGHHGSHSPKEIGFIPFFFFLSLSMLVTFLILMNNQQYFLTMYVNLIHSPVPSIRGGAPVDQNIMLSPVLEGNPTIPKPPVVPSNQVNKPALPESNPIAKPIVSKVPPVKAQESPPPSPPQVTAKMLFPSSPEFPNIIEISRKCPKELEISYNTLNQAKVTEAEENKKWCTDAIRVHHVQIGRSWGSLPRHEQMQWDSKKCNELLNVGNLQTCDERYGWKYFENWLKSKKYLFQTNSKVQCIRDFKTTGFCKMENVVMDFNKMVTHDGSRAFHKGFLTFYGKAMPENSNYLPNYPGIDFQFSQELNQPSIETKDCSYIETRPTFILSNDDIFNLGHYMNDVIGIWSMMLISNAYHPMNQSVLLNIDGFRYGGPAGGPAHRLMLPGRPDEHGPYSKEYYSRWFDGDENVLQAKTYSLSHRKVCFKQLYPFPLPGIPWFWNEWGRDDECSLESSSPIYQSFNVFLRQKLIDSYAKEHQQQRQRQQEQQTVKKRLKFPSEEEYYHIVIEVRSIKKKNVNNHSGGRFIKNLPELIEALQSIQVRPSSGSQNGQFIPIKVTAQDFSLLSFEEQIRLAHTASVFVSMHGAGTTHIFHMAVGDKKCCGLIEMFPDKSVDLYTAKGYSNLARMLGFYHTRYVAADGSTSSTGTKVDTQQLKEMTAGVLKRMVDGEGTCLHNVKDTRLPVFQSPLAFD